MTPSKGREKLTFGKDITEPIGIGEKMKPEKIPGRDWTKEKGICPLCGSPNFKVFYKEPRGFACPDCGISFRLKTVKK